MWVLQISRLEMNLLLCSSHETIPLAHGLFSTVYYLMVNQVHTSNGAH
jgi:hypothetical protein